MRAQKVEVPKQVIVEEDKYAFLVTSNFQTVTCCTEKSQNKSGN